MAKKKRKVSQATRERLRKMRQKFGLGEYKNQSFKKTSTKFRKVSPMARRRTKRSRKASSSFLKPTTILVSSGIYGAMRAKVSGLLAPFTSKIPLGDVADEAGMFALAYLLSKKTSGTFKQVGQMGMAVEAARLGEAVISGSVFGSTASNGGMGSATLG